MSKFSSSFVFTTLLTSVTLFGCHGGAADDPMEPTTRPSAAPAPAITIDEAREVALAKVPGTVLEEEHEKEYGRWVYSFEIRPDGVTSGGVIEVLVDANDRTIIKVEVDDDDDDDDDDD